MKSSEKTKLTTRLPDHPKNIGRKQTLMLLNNFLIVILIVSSLHSSKITINGKSNKFIPYWGLYLVKYSTKLDVDCPVVTIFVKQNF